MTVDDELDSIIEALWVALLCECESCRAVFHPAEHEWIHEQDPMEWAEIVAPSAFKQGYRAFRGRIYCQSCRKLESTIA